MKRQVLEPTRIAELLRLLGMRLNERGVQAEITILGGAAIALAFDSQRATDDIDAIFQPRDMVLSEVSAMANEFGLSLDWLNDAVAFYLPQVPDSNPRVFAEWPGITISTGSPEYLLAMKCLVSRKSPADLEDAATICDQLGIYDEHEVEQIAKRYFPNGTFGAQELWFEDIAIRAQQLRNRAI